MKILAIAFLVVACTGIIIPGLSFAWEDPPVGTSVLMTASCSGDDVVLSIDFNVTQEPGAQFVGWIVERTVIGLCVEEAWVTEVLPWPALGETHLDLTITPEIGFFDAIYRIWAVDVDDNEVFIYWPQRHNYAHADCLPGPTTVGYFVYYGDNVYFEACTDLCWPGLSPFDGIYPDGAEELIGTGQLMNLYGELFSGMEGDFIHSTGMAPSSFTCEPVSNGVTTWDGLKAQFR
ncbi:MAG: hypothetical protein KOO60_11165 [Gemmatimonadales bacterium]|nr:hypothetical protein [Gemmatimonadales bacterium]